MGFCKCGEPIIEEITEGGEEMYGLVTGKGIRIHCPTCKCKYGVYEVKKEDGKIIYRRCN